MVVGRVLVAAVFAAALPAAGLPVHGPPRLVAQVPSGGFVSQMATADFNGDRLPDLVVTRSVFQGQATFPITILLNNGHGGFRDGTAEMVAGAVPQTQNAREIVIADFNGDGRPDIFIADTGDDQPPYPGYKNTLVLSTPDGKLRDASTNLPPESGFTHTAAAADVNGDGSVDLYVGNIGGGDGTPPRILLNDGTGRFTPGAPLPAAQTQNETAGRYTSSLFVDVNGDGSPDLILGAEDHTRQPAVLMNDGRGHFSLLPNAIPAKPFASTAIALDIASADLNGDGHPDLLIAFTKGEPFYVGRWIQVLINNGDGTFRDETPKRLPQADNSSAWPIFLRILDLDGNGTPDIAVQLGGEYEAPPFYLNKGDGTFRAAPASFGNRLYNLYAILNVTGHTGRDFVTISPESHGVFVLPELTTPSTPSGVRSTRGTLASGVRISWRPIPNADTYEVWRAPTRIGRYARIARTTKTSYVDQTARRGRTFFYSVRAINAAGKSAPSPPVSGFRR